jgi:hypothetical protein
MAHRTLSRPIRELVLKVSPSPKGDAEDTVTLRESELAELYPRPIGAKLELGAIPYSLSQWLTPDLPCVVFAVEWMARVSRRVATVEVVLDARHWGTVDIGDEVTVRDVHLRNPSTGLRWQAGDAAIAGVVLEASPDARNQTTRVTVALDGDGLQTARYGAAAALNGPTDVVDETLLARVLEHHFTPPLDPLGDGGHFRPGDQVLPYDPRWRPCVGGVPREVVSVEPDRLTLDGAASLPVTCVFLVAALYDDAATNQRVRQAFVADADANLGAEDAAAYQWGDG